MIDLHTHTNFSDGASSPEQLLRDAQESGADVISITDHINVDVYDYLKTIDIKKYYKGKIIKGVEVYCGYKGKQIELLGYGIDPDKLKPFLNKHFDLEVQIKNLQNQFDYLNSVCKKLGIKTNENIKADKSLAFVKPYFKDNIQSFPENEKFFEKDIWDNYKKFYRLCVCNPESPFYINFCDYYPSVEEVADAIHNTGGKVVIAHSWLYGFDDTMQEVKELIATGKIDGVECYYSDFTQEQSKQLLDYCKENNLMITGGSDYHGINRPCKIAHGNNNDLFIPNELLTQFSFKDYYNEHLTLEKGEDLSC